jgi:hypothetical protein
MTSGRIRGQDPIQLLGPDPLFYSLGCLGGLLGQNLATVLILAERTGKAIRNPARDTMLSHATKTFGHGRSFGLQEALGQGPGPVRSVWPCFFASALASAFA